MLQHAPLRSLGKDLQQGNSINLTGKIASYYFRNVVKLIYPILTQDETLKNLLLLSHVLVLLKVRDNIGLVMRARQHTEESINNLASTGMQGFNLYNAIFKDDEMLPYVFAALMEMPLQVFLPSCVVFHT